MDNILVISQNLKLKSLTSVKKELAQGSVLIVSTQFVFENERNIIDSALGVKCEYRDFADLLSDAERQKCDEDAYHTEQCDVTVYFAEIKRLKNEGIARRVLKEYPCKNRLILCDDLGIDENAWIGHGFRKVKGDYYHVGNPQPSINKLHRVLSIIASQLRLIPQFYKDTIWEAEYQGKKYQFFGSTNRIGYRMDLDFHQASRCENVKYIVSYFSCKLLGYMPRNKTIRMTTFHENGKWLLPDHPNLNVKKIQDGYLPPNYTSKYLLFYGNNTEFYTWDTIGRNTFYYHGLKNRIMPFRKKLFLPEPKYPKIVKKVLCVASGAGDWTAIKNRSDEDMMMWAFGKVAALFPEIEFVYRCHPVWVHPQHQGVNSINRAAEYFDYLNLPNLKLSGNIPAANQDGKFVLSYKRSSFEEDLKDVDLVFGEHSVSMIDAGFKDIIFASCNVTGHRNFFEDITKLGFPHCESVEEIVTLIKQVTSSEFKASYEKAIANYNEMTDKES